MTLDDRIAIVKDLVAKREEIDGQLASLFAGSEVARRPYRRRKADDTPADDGNRSPDSESFEPESPAA